MSITQDIWKMTAVAAAAAACFPKYGGVMRFISIALDQHTDKSSPKENSQVTELPADTPLPDPAMTHPELLPGLSFWVTSKPQC